MQQLRRAQLRERVRSRFRSFQSILLTNGNWVDSIAEVRESLTEDIIIIDRDCGCCRSVVDPWWVARFEVVSKEYWGLERFHLD
jgi:hypothetical protein